jgi:hypothetical protein
MINKYILSHMEKLKVDRVERIWVYIPNIIINRVVFYYLEWRNSKSLMFCKRLLWSWQRIEPGTGTFWPEAQPFTKSAMILPVDKDAHTSTCIAIGARDP